MKKRVQESEYGDIRRLFPDFLWLLRDVSLELPENENGQPMTPREFMLEDVFEKNKEVGSALESFFATVDCRILPIPDQPSSLRESNGSSLGGQNYQFFQEVKKFVAYICGKTRVKNGFQEGERVDGPIFSMLLNSYVEAINDPSARPCLENSWKSVVHVRCLQVIDELVKEYEAEMQQKLANKLPMELAASDENPEQPSLMQIHGDIHRRMLDKLRESTHYYMPADASASETERRKLSDQLTGAIIQTEELPVAKGSNTTGKVVGGILFRFLEKNAKMSREHCAKVFSEVSLSLYEEIKTAESDPASTKSLKDTMPNKIAWLQAEYFEKALGPAKEEILGLKLKELEEYGSRVAGFQRMMREVIDREALSKKVLLEELKAAKAATEEQLKTQEIEQKKQLKEQEEQMQRVKDDLERQLHDESKKRMELEGKLELESKVLQLKQSLEDVGKKQAVKVLLQQIDTEAIALREQMAQKDAALKQAQEALDQAVNQPPQHVQNRKINLLDEDKKKIAMAWFGYRPKKDKVKTEAKRLRLGAPGFSFTYSSEDSWIKFFGEQLYKEELVTLKKTYDIEPSDIVVHKK